MYQTLIYPNLHVALLHFPIALVMIGTFIEVFSFLGWRHSSVRTAGRWMILFGGLLSVPASLTGLYALNQAGWDTMTDPSRKLMFRHAVIEAIASGAIVFIVVTWLGSSDAWRDRLRGIYALLLVAVCGAMGVGAWHSGEGVYRHRVGVAAVDSPPATMPTSLPTLKDVQTMLPPLEMHLVVAGFATAVALAALALSMRGAVTPITPVKDMDELTLALSSEEGERSARRTRVPSARFWLITFFMLVGTSALGWLVLASSVEVRLTEYHALWNYVKDPSLNEGRWLTRRMAHVIGAVTIISLPLLLAIFARVAPRRKMLLGFFGLILVAAIAAQVWVGTLMMFESPAGPVTRFAPKAAE